MGIRRLLVTPFLYDISYANGLLFLIEYPSFSDPGGEVVAAAVSIDKESRQFTGGCSHLPSPSLSPYPPSSAFKSTSFPLSLSIPALSDQSQEEDVIQREEKETISMSNRELQLLREASVAGGEDDSLSSSSFPSLSSSKNARIKFLCSYGGKILPRPRDGRLKYVGGDIRVLVLARSVSFSELRERIQGMFRHCMVIKYKLVSEDLDTLVTVADDEDLVHMLDEYDRVDMLHPQSPSAASSPRFRLFLFPAPSSSAADPAAAATLDQRYVNAINAAVPGSPGRPSIFSVSAAISPTSTIDCSGEFLATHPAAHVVGGRMNRVQSTPNLAGGGMHRVSSTPNLSGGGSLNPAGGAGLQYQQNLSYHHHLQHHHLPHRHSTAAPVSPVHATGSSGASRAGRNEVCGCCAMRGGVHYGGGGGVGNMPIRSAGEEPHSGRASRSTSPFRAVPREPVIWE
ncbi:uncharacterized protein LOC122050251 [Zingiber officinale]|uniref:uncharacterized protein LOC122050251 n=1 Tax=Zingiber officinale TaxID=94328 RepID=UPI001C4B6524|nr:uncharacterized protein LOC122050251 [Zingiber officinale]